MEQVKVRKGYLNKPWVICFPDIAGSFYKYN